MYGAPAKQCVKLSDTLINMSNDAEEKKGQINYDNKYVKNLTSSIVKDVIKDCSLCGRILSDSHAIKVRVPILMGLAFCKEQQDVPFS